MNLFQRAQQALTGKFQEQDAVIQQAAESQNKVFYPAFIGSGRVMHTLALNQVRSPRISFVDDRQAIYRVRPGDVYAKGVQENRFLADVYDIQHPALQAQKRAYLMVPDSLTNARALSVTTPLEVEISENAVDAVYICLDQRLTHENLHAILSVLGTIRTKVKAVPIFSVQFNENIDPAEAETLSAANLSDLDEVGISDSFQICAADHSDAAYARFIAHLDAFGTALHEAQREVSEKECIEVLKWCRQSCIDERRLIGVKQHVFPSIPSPAMLTQRNHTRQATEIKNRLMAIFKLANGNGGTLLKEVMRLVENAKSPGDFEQAALRCCLLINNLTMEALSGAVADLNDAYTAVLHEYLNEINEALQKAGLPELAMPRELMQFAVNENVHLNEVGLKPALTSTADNLFRMGIGGSLGSGTALALAKALAELGILTGAGAGAPGAIIAGGIGFVLGLTLSIVMIESANKRAYTWEYDRRVQEAIRAVASETERIFNAISLETNYVVYDTLALIEDAAKTHLKNFKQNLEAYEGMGAADLAELLQTLEDIQNNIDTLLAEVDTDDAQATDDVEADADADADTTDADTTDDVEADAESTDAADAPDDVEADADADTTDADTTDDVEADAEGTDAADASDDAEADAEKQ